MNVMNLNVTSLNLNVMMNWNVSFRCNCCLSANCYCLMMANSFCLSCLKMNLMVSSFCLNLTNCCCTTLNSNCLNCCSMVLPTNCLRNYCYCMSGNCSSCCLMTNLMVRSFCLNSKNCRLMVSTNCSTSYSCLN